MGALFSIIPGEKQIIVSGIIRKQNDIRSIKEVLITRLINYGKLPCMILFKVFIIFLNSKLMDKITTIA